MLKNHRNFALRGNVWIWRSASSSAPPSPPSSDRCRTTSSCRRLRRHRRGGFLKHLHRAKRRALRFACRGAAGRRTDMKYRPLHQQRDQLPDRHLRLVHGDQGMNQLRRKQEADRQGSRRRRASGTADGNPRRPGQTRLRPHSTMPSPSLGVNKFCACLPLRRRAFASRAVAQKNSANLLS